VKTVSELKENDFYDVIIVSIRFNQLSSVIDLLNKNVSQNIIFNGNNTRVEKTVNALPGKNVMFSFSLSAGKREQSYVNSIDLKKITIGDVNGRDNQELINSLLSNTGYKVVYQPNMKDYLISHTAFVVPVSFACYHTDGDLRTIRRDKAYLEQVTKANIECYEALEKLNIEILPEEDKAFRTEKWFKKVMSFYKLMCSTSLGKLCASDHAMSAIDEMQALAMDMKELIKKAGIDSPNFDTTWEDIRRYC